MSLVKLMFVPGLLLLIVVGFGLWVSNIGKPYNGWLFTIHKLVALGAAILAGYRIYQLDPIFTFPLSVLLLIALAGVGVVAMFATGAIMSIQDRVEKSPQLIHQVSAVLIVGSMVLALYLEYNQPG